MCIPRTSQSPSASARGRPLRLLADATARARAAASEPAAPGSGAGVALRTPHGHRADPALPARLSCLSTGRGRGHAVVCDVHARSHLRSRLRSHQALSAHCCRVLAQRGRPGPSSPFPPHVPPSLPGSRHPASATEPWVPPHTRVPCLPAVPATSLLHRGPASSPPEPNTSNSAWEKEGRPMRTLKIHSNPDKTSVPVTTSHCVHGR